MNKIKAGTLACKIFGHKFILTTDIRYVDQFVTQHTKSQLIGAFAVVLLKKI